MNTGTNTVELTLTVWRDSVQGGDDVDAPHETKIGIRRDESLGSVIGRVVAGNFLACVGGGAATWIAESGTRPLAVVAQQWAQPRFLVTPEQTVCSIVGGDCRCHLNFRYWCQADPDRVFECLQDGKPLPEKTRIPVPTEEE
jgi:hypothetical protein